ncbi:MAG: four-carbon acid sugar kinase family protein, partial [Anaerolineaceae bacterium]|nr:four-carbon acid sugar kinase family protein [Anaerolineaceae bacterium]
MHETETSSPFLPAIIADDLSGALDSGVQFARFGFATRLMLRNIEPWPVVVINTASRELAPEDAARRCRQATRSLSGRKLYKKIDSTLRGQVGVEIEAVLAESGCTKAVVCPAAPLQGRVVRGGQIYVNGVLLHESGFRDDPSFPARTSSITGLI